MDLTQFPLFGRLDADISQDIAAEIEIIELPAEGVLFRQGDPGDACYFVLAGKLCALMRGPDGQECCLNELEAGAAVGEMALLTGQPRIATIVAVQDSQVGRLSKAAFERLVEKHPRLLSQLMAELQPRYRRVQLSLALKNIFGPLDDDAIHEMEHKLEWRCLDSGEELFHQGRPGEAMYLVVQGRLRYSVEDPLQGERLLGEVGAGESIGEFALLAESGSPESFRSATVTATRQTDLVAITRPAFEQLIAQYPQALLNLTRKIIQRQRRLIAPHPTAIGALVITLLPAHADQSLEAFSHQLVAGLSALGSTLHLDPEAFDAAYGKPGAAQTPLDHPTSGLVKAWLDEREGQVQYLALSAQPALDAGGRLTPWAQRCVEDSDVLLLAAEAGLDAAPGPVEMALSAARTCARLELVLLHPADCTMPSSATDWGAIYAGDDARAGACLPIREHHHVRIGHAADTRRLARRIIGQPVGLALAGGGARGWAHIGAIQAIEEAGIEVDWVAGASMGAIIAAGYAMDWSPERLKLLAADFGDPKKLLDYTLPYTSLVATRRITAMLQQLCSGAMIEDAWRPFFSISVDLTDRLERIHRNGPLWKAVRASMALPGVFAPVLEDGHVLIDGGAANNLPIDRMRGFCPTGTVIGVDLLTSSPLAKDYDFGPWLSGWRAAIGRLVPFLPGVSAPSLVDIVSGLVDTTTRYRLNDTQGCADLIIQVPVHEYGILDFDKHAEIIELGYRAAREQLRDYMR